MSIFSGVLIWLSFDLGLAAYVAWRHLGGSSRASGSATLTLIDHYVETIGGYRWKSDTVEIWRDHRGELQTGLLVQKHVARVDGDDNATLSHLPDNAIPV